MANHEDGNGDTEGGERKGERQDKEARRSVEICRRKGGRKKEGLHGHMVGKVKQEKEERKSSERMERPNGKCGYLGRAAGGRREL